MDPDNYDLNLLFLKKAREWLVSGQEHKARLLLGVTPDAAAALRDLAASNVLCYRLRLPPEVAMSTPREWTPSVHFAGELPMVTVAGDPLKDMPFID